MMHFFSMVAYRLVFMQTSPKIHIDITMQFEDHELTGNDFRPSSRRQPSQSSEGRFGVFESVDLSG